MPQTILDVARDGDVVITMGAGSIGAVPGNLLVEDEMSDVSEKSQFSSAAPPPSARSP
jgi:hypothetical protein